VKLTIYSPAKTLYSGDVTLCEVPGGRGRFTILAGHDSIVSTLTEGVVRYATAAGEKRLEIKGGYVEVDNDEIKICAKQ
jgi:F-type H+-transporting ATPase subunit epsilon